MPPSLKRRLRALLLAAATLPLGGGSTLAAGACCPPVRAVEASWPIAAAPEIVIDWQELRWAGADDLGGVYALGRRPAPGGGFEHFLAISWDDGQTWDPRTPLVVGAPGKLYARAAVSAGGILLLAFSDGNEVSVVRSADQGRSFAEPQALGPIEAFGPASIAMADDGRVLAAWRVDAGDRQQLHAAVSTDFGSSWRPTRVLRESGPGLGLTRPQPLVTTGAVLIAWSEDLEDPPGTIVDRAFTRTSIDGGETWFPPDRVSVPEDTTGWVVLARTSLNELQALYASRVSAQEYELRVNTSFNAGFEWAADDAVVSPPLREDAGSLFSFPDGSCWAVWFERDDPVVEDVGAIVARRSPAHGRPGTWAPPSRLSEEGLEQHDFRLSQGEDGVVDLVHDDYRERPDCPHPADLVQCESVYLDHSCDEGASWLPDELRLDLEEPPVSPHSEEPQVVRSPSGRLHVFYTNNSSAAEEFEDQLVHVGLDPVGRTPELQVEHRPPEGCTGSFHAFTVRSETVDWCLAPTYSWFLDEALVPGETGERFELPEDTPAGEHEVRFELHCGGDVDCRLRSETMLALVEPPADSQVEGLAITGPLLVARNGAGELLLSWEDLGLAATGHSVLRGTIRSLHEDRRFDHAGEPCHLPRPPGETSLETTVAPPAADSYWLVLPADCAGEGSAGSTSLGAERPSGGCGPMPD